MSDRPTFYIDRCLGKAVAQALRDAGASMQIHDDHFAQDAADEQWIPDVTERGWIILTKDKNIRRRAGEREAVVTAQAKIITLTSGNMKGTDMASLLVARLADMEQLAATQVAPFVAVVGPGGMQVVFPKPIQYSEESSSPEEEIGPSPDPDSGPTSD